MNASDRWVAVKLRSLSLDQFPSPENKMSSLTRPLLSAEPDVNVDAVSETDIDLAVTELEGEDKQESSLSPEILVEVSSPDDGVSPAPHENQPERRKKKLVWADIEESLEPEVGNMGNGVSRSPSILSPQDSLVVLDRQRPQSYILYEGREGEGEGFIHVKRERSRSSMLAGNSVVSEGDITDDQFSSRNDFIKVEVPTDGTSMNTAQELQICKKTVLKPFLIFLKLIGWRSFLLSRQDITPSRWVKVLNFTYPTVLFLLLVLSCATQIVTCFYRDQPVQLGRRGNGPFVIDCRDDLFTRLIFPDVLLLLAYLWGLYIFRYGAPEHLITLVETVFLSSQHIRKGQTKMVHFMRLIMFGGFLWLVFDVCVSIARLLSLDLLGSNSFLYFLSDLDHLNFTLNNSSAQHTTNENILRYVFVIFDFFGFIFFDLLYIAVMVTYISQCQLVRLYIGTIMDKVLTKLKGYTLEQAMTDINQTYKFLQVVNGKLSALTSVCLLVFLEAAVSSLYGVFTLDIRGESSRKALAGVVGVCNAILWSFIAVVPIIQAARLTSRCQQLRRLGLSIGHRPFVYHNTPQLLLDSFVQYTNATRYRAKLAGMPIYPSFVIGGFFFFLLLGSILVVFLPTFHVAPWL